MSNDIFVNQIGYSPKQKKLAYVRASSFENVSEFSLIDSNNNTVFKGQLKKLPADKLSDEEILLADFSDFQTEGQFKVQISDGTSFPFKIGNNIYNKFYYDILNYFYLSRCGQDLSSSQAGDFAHPACHTSTAEIYGTSQTKNVIGGWHDAGDYGRYIVAGSKTVMDLLLAYEQSKDSFTDFDILNEVRFELEWMLQMQREDGAVYHKISCYHFCAFILPQEETDKQVIAPVSTAATADFAGCLAFAAKFFKDSDSEFANILISAAKKAQLYLDTHGDELYRNPEEITTGGYGDWNVYDERYFALCSLFAETKDPDYLTKAISIRQEALNLPKSEEFWKKNWSQSFGWGCVAGYGTEILINNADIIPQTQEAQNFFAEVKKEIIDGADKLLSYIEESNYDVGITHSFWGSNGFVSDNAHHLLIAYDMTGKQEYYDAAEKQLNYLLGCNPMNICYVTGQGSVSPVKPHHRPSGALKKVMPGMIAGGPCQGLMDQVAKTHLEGKAPLKCYIDHYGSYSTNEIAIYWNSPLVYVIAKLGKV